MNELDLEAERTSVAAWLQRRIGSTIAVTSVLLASVSFVYGLWDGIGPLESFLHPTVVVTLVWSIVAALTTVRLARVARIVQVTLVTIVMLLAAFTSTPTELTSLLFLGLAVAIAYAYDLFGSQLRYYVAGTATLLILAIWARIRLLGEYSPWAIIQWLLGAVLVVALYLLLLQAAHRWVTQRQAQLEQQVDSRTHELNDALRRSEELRERNSVLLQELHHRTKNNLQLISSLLSLEQSDPDVESKSVGQVLETARRRVQAMATAHQLLHHSDKTSEVNIAQFMQELTNEFVRSGQVSDIKIDTAIEQELEVQMEFAVPIGLVVSELIANSAEHAWTDGRQSTVWLSMHSEGESLVMTIEDQGCEFPEHISIDRPESTGLQIVTGLVAQIQGTIDLQKKPNTKWIITAPLPG